MIASQSSIFRSKQPSAYFVIVSLLAIWAIIVTVGFLKISEMPYVGMMLEGDAANSHVKVRFLTNNAPASDAGIELGDRFVAIETLDGKERYEFKGPEAYSGRHRISSYKQYNEMLEGKRSLWQFVQQPSYVLVQDSGERHTVVPNQNREFWSSPSLVLLASVLLFQSLIILVVSTGIFAFAVRSIGVKILFVAGLGWAINTIANALIISREIILDPAIYSVIHLTSKAGSTTFVYALICLVWYVPAPINRFPFWQTAIVSALFVYGAHTFQFYEFPFHAYELPNLILLFMGIAITAVQWIKSRNDPIKRATSQWVILSIYGALAIIVALYTLPLLMGQKPLINPLLASALWMLTFLGLALGTLRFRLFEVQKYWWRTVTWIVGGIVVIMMDLLLISQFDFNHSQAIPLALLLAGWIYFPIRQFVFGHFVTSKDSKVDNHVVELIQTFGAAKNTDVFAEKFSEFMKCVFNAKEVSHQSGLITKFSTVQQNGLELIIPDIVNDSSLSIFGKASGTQLFSSGDTKTADALVKLIQNLNNIKLREQQLVKSERERIVRDLHDDVGGKLLSLVYKAPDGKTAEGARDTLAALKESMLVIENSETIDLQQVWKKLAKESKERLDEAGFQNTTIGDLENTYVDLTARQYINLKHVVQELISNVIKHADKHSASLSIEVEADSAIKLVCRNQTGKTEEDSVLSGRGMGNIAKRLNEISGTVAFENEGRSFVARVEFPVSQA